MLRLPRKMTMEVSKALLLPRQMQRIILGKRCESNAPDTQNDFRHVLKHVGTSRHATPATQNDIATRFEPFEKDSLHCAASPVDMATAEENQKIDNRHVAASKRISCQTSSISYTS